MLEFGIALGPLLLLAGYLIGVHRERSAGWALGIICSGRPCPHTAPYVRIQLKNGDIYGGFVTDYSEQTALSDRELVLGAPLTRRTDATVEPLEDSWQRVVVTGPEIQTLWVSYITSPIRQVNADASRAQDNSVHKSH
jgi:Family of unknown function (DUF6338)